MMVLDSSAIIAIEFREPGFLDLLSKIASADKVIVGAPTLFESAQVLSRVASVDSWTRLEAFCSLNGIEIVPFESRHSQIAFEAFNEFGKGRHSAALNLGDCMAYAIAKVQNGALLFVGNDFAQTDVVAA